MFLEQKGSKKVIKEETKKLEKEIANKNAEPEVIQEEVEKSEENQEDKVFYVESGNEREEAKEKLLLRFLFCPLTITRNGDNMKT